MTPLFAMIKNFLLLFIFIIYQGCASYSTQLTALQSSRDDTVDVDQFFMVCELSRAGSLSIPHKPRRPDSLCESGWINHQVQWLEIFQVIIPESDINSVLNYMPDQVIVTGSYNYQMICSPWEAESIGASIKHNRQCFDDQTSADNYLLVNELGETVEIHQFISDDLGYLNLKKL